MNLKGAVDELTGLSPEQLADMYLTMTTIAQGEAELVHAVRSGNLKASVYPVRGLEGVCAALGTALEPSDYLVSTYRNLGDALAKGVPFKNIVAEDYGRSTGTSHGKGGPMHLTDVENGLMGTSGIVGGAIPIGVGLALAAQLDGEGQVAVATFGDGAMSIGAAHESLNLAALWKLPMVFVCQNNQWGEHTPAVEHAGNPNLAERAASYGMRSVQVDGFDQVATWNAVKQAVADARSGQGPVFVEAITYRLSGHTAASDYAYMPKDEFEAAMNRDPVPNFRAWLETNGTVSPEELDELDARAAAIVAEGMEFGRNSPPPSRDVLFKNVFADADALPSRSAQWRNL